MRRTFVRIGCGAALVGAALAAHAQEEGAGWCRNRQMYAVPAPAEVTIDGRLDDWDLSGAIESFVMAETRENQTARFALMYDADALFIGVTVRDPTPLINHRDPVTEGDMGWDGDALQFRIGVNPSDHYPQTDATWMKEHNSSLVHLTMWNYTERQEPVLVVQTGMDYRSVPGAGKFSVIPPGGYQARYVMADDRRGYSLEYRIPWATLTARQPLKAGDTVAAAMQVLWGKTGNEHIGINGVTYDLQIPGGFAYQNSALWGKVIFSKEGRLPKELTSAGLPVERPLPLTFEYDLPETGEVTLQLFDAHNEVVRVIAGEASRLAGRNTERWDGLDSLGRPLPPGTYTWKGLYHQPITTRHVLSVENSGQPPWKTDGNNGGWGGDHAPACAVCTAGPDLLLSWISAEAGYGLIRVDAQGRKQWGVLRSGISQLASDGERVWLSTGFFEDDGEIHPSFLVCHGIEVLSAKDFRPLLFGNGAKTLAPPADGRPEADNVIGGLALSKGTLFAAYRRRNLVVAYDAAQGTQTGSWEVPSPGALAARPDGALVLVADGTLSLLRDGKLSALATDHLDRPKGLALDGAGNICVANWGALQNVSIFSTEGKYLKSIGVAGGRPRVGAYDPAGMLNPKGIAIDAAGRLWVTEASEAPKRISVWNVQTGALEKEFFGAAHYSASIWMDPEHPDEVYCDNVFWKIDLDRKTGYPKSTVWRGRDPNSPGLYGTHGMGFKMFTAANGRQYGWGNDEHLAAVLSVRDGDVMKPLLAFFWTYAQKKYIGYPIAMDTGRYPDLGTFIWVDRNHDQILQEPEIASAAALPAECAKLYFRGFACVDKDLNIWHASGAVNRPLRILADGTPEYDFARPEVAAVKETGFVDAAGCLYTLTQNDSNPDKIGYGKWAPDGTLLWGLKGFENWPKAVSYPTAKPGKLWGATALLGIAGEFTGFNSYFGVPHLYTTDGVFVSRILRDVRTLSEKLDADVISCENYNGCLVKPKGMERYFFLGGDQDGRVTEVLGLDTVRRLQGGEVVIREEDTQRVAAALADYNARTSAPQKLVVAHGLQALDTAQPVAKALDSKRRFEARAAYDERNLYVRFKVTAPARLVNGIGDPTLVFKGGNLLDIQIAADPQADPARKTPAPGDVRILVSRQQGKPMAVVFRPKVAEFAGSPTVLTSPTGKESFDAIELTDRIALDYVEDRNLPTFTAQVTVPLDLIGWKPVAGARVRMDLGYVYGNTEGTKATARSYWTNNGFSANILNDVPNESRLEPALWGTAEIE